jgi:hypothetical protein
MKITLKVGSEITLPFGDTSQLESSGPTILAVKKQASGLKLTALAPGAVTLTVTLGVDFTADLEVEVVA